MAKVRSGKLREASLGYQCNRKFSEIDSIVQKKLTIMA